MIDWLNSPPFGAPTTWAEVLGFVTGALCVLLVARRNIANWPVGIANNLLWILLFATAGLYADSALQVVYIALALYGWWQWRYGGVGRRPLPVSTLTPTEWVVLAGALLAGTAAITVVLDRLTGSTVPFWDAITTVLSLLATYGQSRKKVESWYFWIAADLIYIPLYQAKGLTLTAILYVVFLGLCLYGLVGWRREAGRDRALSGDVSLAGSA